MIRSTQKTYALRDLTGEALRTMKDPHIATLVNVIRAYEELGQLASRQGGYLDKVASNMFALADEANARGRHDLAGRLHDFARDIALENRISSQRHLAVTWE